MNSLRQRRKLRGITLFFCSDHASSWIEWGGRIYGAPCKNRDACKANGAATPNTYVLTDERTNDPTGGSKSQ